jgi:diguanylate cyclase
VLVDFDRFSKINLRLGTRSGDRTIGAVAGQIVEGLSADRGVERLVRIGGQSLLIVLGDNGPRQALATAERLRQAIEATTFDDEGTEFELTVSCGVVEGGRNESVAELLRRASEALKFAKKSGRNRCALDEGQGPTLVDPPQFPVKGRIINLDVPRVAMPAPVAVTQAGAAPTAIEPNSTELGNPQAPIASEAER